METDHSRRMVLWMVAWNRFHSSDTGSLTSFLSLPTFRFNPGYPYRFNFFSSFTLSSFPLERKIKKFEIESQEENRSIRPNDRNYPFWLKLKIHICLENIVRFWIYIYREEIKIKYKKRTVFLIVISILFIYSHRKVDYGTRYRYISVCLNLQYTQTRC